MGDGSDDPNQVEELFSLINRGVSVAVATRYSKGGQYVGSSTLKYLLRDLPVLSCIIYFLLGQRILQTCLKLISKIF